MKSRRFLDSRVGYSLTSLGLLLGVVAPGVMPAFASADQLNSRSIQMSSSAISATGVNYQVTFTPSGTYQNTVIDFCAESPILGQTCTLPTGMSISGVTASYAATGPSTLTTTTTSTAVKVAATTSSTDNTAKVLTISGITNPSTLGTFYARIYTYVTSPTTAYTSATSVGTPLDNGGIAMSTTNSVGVSAAVRESLTFCVSAADPGPNCGQTGQVVTTPSISLGHGSPVALDSTATDTADIFTQLSTNAAHGAVVSMKNSNACGGLKRVDAATCDIAPANTSNAIGAGNAFFGMKLAAPAGGTGTVTRASSYGDTTNYGMNYTGANTGVTSAYGDQIYSSTAPVNNVGEKLTFAASVSNATPAGLYTAQMNLVATGTY